MCLTESRDVKRVIEESVPGKQVTIAHVIASPVPEVYECLGIDALGAIGILTLSPFETAVIAADIAAKAWDVESVWTALRAVNDTLERVLGFTVAEITRT